MPLLNFLHLLPQPGKPPRLDLLPEHRYLFLPKSSLSVRHYCDHITCVGTVPYSPFFRLHLLPFSTSFVVLLEFEMCVCFLCLNVCLLLLVVFCSRYSITTDYRNMYSWAPANPLEETSLYTTRDQIIALRKEKCQLKYHFGRESNIDFRIIPCREDEPI